MGLYGYSIKIDAKKQANVQAHDLDASYKDLANICRAVKKKSIADAKKILDGVISMEMPLLYTFHHTGMGHRSQLGGKKGRYPKKEAKIMLKLINDAKANALQKGLDEKKLYISHAAANRQNVMKRYRKFWATGATLGYGKQAVWANYETARVELVLSERENNQKQKKKHGQIRGAKPAAQDSKPKTQDSKPAAAKTQ
ncbi:MAG: 50S ribosomal protein L22 [Candidatus Micrarchaeia archaeon]|jgi:large subunit ribosomal protein L22